MKYDYVYIGADPELFLKDTSGNYVSSIDKIGGTKSNPKKIDIAGTAVQEDNVAVEYNIVPSQTVEEFVANNFLAISYLDRRAKELGLSLAMDATALFPKSELEDMRALQFGCEPDFNVWSNEYQSPPALDSTNWNLRTAGGHIHVGYKNPTEESSIELVKAMDLFVGLPAIKYDTDVVRRTRYGTAGSCRFKPYGVEYRTPSNFWIKSRQAMVWIYKQTHAAISFLNRGGKIDEEDCSLIISGINSPNRDYSHGILNYLETKYA